MIDGRCVLPECHADTLLIRLMGFERPAHKYSIGAVANAMKDGYKNRAAVGVIDNDKGNIPKYFDDFETESKTSNFIFKHLPDKKRFLVVVTPAFESCIFNIAEELRVNPADYGFKSMKQFKNATKDKNVQNNQNVKQFLNTLIQKKGKDKKDSPLQEVKTWIIEKLEG